jgi:hypothetical protein
MLGLCHTPAHLQESIKRRAYPKKTRARLRGSRAALFVVAEGWLLPAAAMMPMMAAMRLMMMVAMVATLPMAGAGWRSGHCAHDGDAAQQSCKSFDAELHSCSPILRTRALKVVRLKRQSLRSPPEDGGNLQGLAAPRQPRRADAHGRARRTPFEPAIDVFY